MNRCIAFLHWFSIVVAVNALVAALIIFTNLLFGCVVWGQGSIASTNNLIFDGSTIRHLTPEDLKDYPSGQIIERRGAMPPVPPLPRQISRTISTNNQGERVTVIIEKPPDLPALVRDKPRTNAFWVMCPNCSVRAIRTPLRMETVGSVSTPDGDVLERAIYFRCCQQEFKARNFKRVEVPIAEEVTVPVK